MERWAGKVAVVTGASAGIGAVLVKELVKAGLIVVGLARRVERVQALAADLDELGGNLHACRCDITVEADILAAFQWVADHVGHVHILVNNAGYVAPTTLMDGDTDIWRTILDTNLMGTAIATREALRVMKAHGIAGHVVHVNSVAGNRNLPSCHMYGASKHAITNMSELLRHELREEGSKVKLTSIYPGLVDTDMIRTGTEETVKHMEMLPKLKPEAIVNGIMYALGTPADVQIAHMTIQPVGEYF